jgi:tRNA(Ile)-lysidine synthase
VELAGHDQDSLGMLWSALAGRLGLALDRRGTRRLTSFTMSDRSSGSMPLAGGWRVDVAGDELVLRPHADKAPAEVSLAESGVMRWGSFRFRAASPDEPILEGADDTQPAWTASLPLGSRLTVRPWAAGDRLGPAAGQQRRRVKRYLTDAGLRGLDRAAWPVVVADDDVVWIPGVRRSDAATARSGRPVRSYVCERLDR